MKDDKAPLVSVVMANLDGAAHIAAAVRSVLRQTERSLELIVSDDGSKDGSLEIAQAAAGGDPRLVILQSEVARSGPAAARNRALAVARGRWVAIVDNDDFIHPERLQRLIWSAEREFADIAADDLLVFYEDGSKAPHGHLPASFTHGPQWVSAAEYERSNRLLSGRRALGYLKPVFRRSLGAAYDETLRIAEDSDLILRLLAKGARMRVYPELGYFYRKHSRSISHRLDAAAIDAMDAAYARIDARGDVELTRALGEGAEARADARAFTALVAALKRRDVSAALGVAVRRPGALALLRNPLAARLPKRRIYTPAEGKPRVALLSRQRIVGVTNGSSAYVLSLAQALKEAGFAVDYIGASPKIFGRWAMLRLREETGVFDRYSVHGGMRVGPMVFSTEPGRWIASAIAVAERVLARIGVKVSWSEKAEYAQGAALTRADALFVARHAGPATCAVLCDYAFLNPLAPYALAPNAPAITIMHDLMSARVADDAESDVVVLSAAEEFRLLNMADVILAIQTEEADKVRAKAAAHVDVILTPHAVAPLKEAQAGRDDALLFVGSNTAPNWVGLEWFFSEVWPAVRAARPAAKLRVAGSVARGLKSAPEGVELLGVVDDLSALYRDAAVVISPLRSGSGLKIKLIEAWAAGKAVVGTTVTAQGVEELAGQAMVVADEPADTARAIVSLLGDAHARRALGERGLRVARERFSVTAAMAAFVARVRSAAGERPPALRDEAGQRHERTDQNEGERGVEAHLADQQPS